MAEGIFDIKGAYKTQHKATWQSSKSSSTHGRRTSPPPLPSLPPLLVPPPSPPTRNLPSTAATATTAGGGKPRWRTPPTHHPPPPLPLQLRLVLLPCLRPPSAQARHHPLQQWIKLLRHRNLPLQSSKPIQSRELPSFQEEEEQEG